MRAWLSLVITFVVLIGVAPLVERSCRVPADLPEETATPASVEFDPFAGALPEALACADVAAPLRWCCQPGCAGLGSELEPVEQALERASCAASIAHDADRVFWQEIRGDSFSERSQYDICVEDEVARHPEALDLERCERHLPAVEPLRSDYRSCLRAPPRSSMDSDFLRYARCMDLLREAGDAAGAETRRQVQRLRRGVRPRSEPWPEPQHLFADGWIEVRAYASVGLAIAEDPVAFGLDPGSGEELRRDLTAALDAWSRLLEVNLGRESADLPTLFLRVVEGYLGQRDGRRQTEALVDFLEHAAVVELVGPHDPDEPALLRAARGRYRVHLDACGVPIGSQRDLMAGLDACLETWTKTAGPRSPLECPGAPD